GGRSRRGEEVCGRPSPGFPSGRGQSKGHITSGAGTGAGDEAPPGSTAPIGEACPVHLQGSFRWFLEHTFHRAKERGASEMSQGDSRITADSSPAHRGC